MEAEAAVVAIAHQHRPVQRYSQTVEASPVKQLKEERKKKRSNLSGEFWFFLKHKARTRNWGETTKWGVAHLLFCVTNPLNRPRQTCKNSIPFIYPKNKISATYHFPISPYMLWTYIYTAAFSCHSPTAYSFHSHMSTDGERGATKPSWPLSHTDKSFW